MRPSKRSVISGIIWSLTQSWGVKAITFVIFAILARVLGPEDLGTYAAAMAVIAILAIFADQGLGDALVQRATITPRQVSAVFLINLALSGLLAAGLWMAAPALAASLKIPDFANVVRALSIGLLINAACFSQQAMHRRNFNFRWLAVCALASTLLSGALGVYLAWRGAGVWSLVWQALSGALVNAALLWIKPQWRFSLDADWNGVRPLLSYGSKQLGASLLHYANTRSIELAIAFWLGAAALGIYAIGARVYESLVFALSTAVMPIAHSTFSRLAQDKKAIVAAYYTTVTVASAAIIPIFCFVAALSREAIVMVFGETWAESAAFLRPLALMGAIQVIEYYNGIIINAVGRPGIALGLVAFKAALTLVLLYAVRDQDLLVIMYVYILGQISSTPLSFYFVRRLIGASMVETGRKALPFVSASILATASIFAMREYTALHAWAPLWRALALGTAGLAVYLGLAMAISGMRIRDLQLAVRSLREDSQKDNAHERG
jgi:O-antigen/teichoic acid export membrane protein